MCESSQNLIAWLDGELAESEAANAARHVKTCTDCRRKLDQYRQASSAFDAYCASATRGKARPELLRSIPAIASTAAAIAIAVTLYLGFARRPVEQLPLQPAAASAPPETLIEAAPAPIRKIHRRYAAIARRGHDPVAPLPEPALEIAIPAEDIFPPGAVPAGVTFTADFSVAADGSVERLRLQPRLIEVQRRSTQP